MKQETSISLAGNIMREFARLTGPSPANSAPRDARDEPLPERVSATQLSTSHRAQQRLPFWRYLDFPLTASQARRSSS